MRYLAIKIDENLNWKIHMEDLASKLNRANSVLSKIRHFVSSKILRTVYFAIFQSHINYDCIDIIDIIDCIDIINIECSIFVNNCFKLALVTHYCTTRSARNSLLFVPSYNSVRFVRKSIIHSVTLTWNHLQDKLTEYDFFFLSPKNLILLKFFISGYDN